MGVQRDQNGKIEKFKSRLVVKGCSQQFGVDYKETFSPVIRFETMRMVIALPAEMKMHSHQMDALSSTKAEYIASAIAAKVAIYLWCLLKEIGVNEWPITIYGDNLSAQQLVKTPHSDAK